MKQALPLATWEQTRLLSDPRRLRLLRLLMARPATLSQLARAVGQSPAWVQHHLRQLVRAGLVQAEGSAGRGRPRTYRAAAGAFVLQRLVLPESTRPTAVFAGSHDLALERLASRLAPHLDLVLYPVGSLDGLVNLRQGLCHLSGAHLLDEDGSYNLPTVRRLFPSGGVRVVTLARRVQGLMFALGNPHGIRGLEDLARPDLRFVNRNRGSGTRVWLDARLRERGIAPQAVRGYGREVATHTAAARAVAAGEADVALGLEAAARAAGLGFLPLFTERFDLIFPEEATRPLLPLLEALPGADFRRLAGDLPGYDLAPAGTVVA